MKRAYIPSAGIRKIPHLAAFLPEFALQKSGDGAQVVLGWGLRPTTHKARAWAAQRGVPFVALEDGFVRSLGLGVQGYPPFSMVVDDVGIYYDTTQPSRLENLLLAQDASFRQPENLVRAQAACDFLLAHCLSKYNHAPMFDAAKLPEKALVLVVDQTFGDMAVKFGQADETHFAAMLRAAVAENPDAEIWVKTHPDVLSGKKRGYLGDVRDLGANVRLFTDDVNPISFLQCVDKVYCVTSQMGFEALLCGKSVVTFGVPWYAGWGVSDDRHTAALALANSPRRASRSVLQLFQAAYLDYARYINPNTGATGALEDVLDYLRHEARFNQLLAGDVFCVGMSLWKRAVMKPFFAYPACRLHFAKSVAALAEQRLPENSKILMWGYGKTAIEDFARERGLAVLRMEDGFVRSVGLGSNLVQPLSLVLDDLGIYFAADKPSRLEFILQNQIFGQQDIQLAHDLQEKLTHNQISKYNVGNTVFKLPEAAAGKRVLLVPGQVEDDASIRFGSPEIQRNADLLSAVRVANPDAFIIYKPHPDVVSGNRVGEVSAADLARLADMSAPEADILSCLNVADEVHTMTSLTGFEALLRGKKVFCYGLPFYAGWGLTTDKLSLSRRTRQLTLPELISGTLVYYPQYVHHDWERRINAAAAIDLLTQQKQALNGKTALHRSFAAKQWGKLVQLYRSLRPK
ncbi:capsular polysaccharide biosynthesis protein [Neisseriaceae bacterium B1]